MPSYVIVGASRGIGFALVKKLVEDERNTVVGLVRNVDGTKAKYEAELQGHKNLHVVYGDLSNIKSLEAAAGKVAAITNGAVDVFVANAAIGSTVTKPLVAEITDAPDAYEKSMLDTFRTNVIGTTSAVAYFAPLVAKSTLKKIAVISTGVADLEFTLKSGFDVHTPYAASKAALNMAVAKLHLGLRDKGVTVFAISPGLVDTGFTEDPSVPPPTEAQEAAKLAETMRMLGQFKAYAPNWELRMMTPDESAEAVLKVIAGATLEKNGGIMVSHYGDQNWL
ncbi:short chain dehydrogenase [Ophiostoma piceae UAMH 11346]|uniref:Short chain dehydrogenase n=1 Tax=Ophiostoma piceae (strain UAMH 11346) TaxID=1262450 RepID=S3BVC9_OPHP1|nr:short chain dehydrogenase [Ophiostoma piceae UAMH 11346]